MVLYYYFKEIYHFIMIIINSINLLILIKQGLHPLYLFPNFKVHFYFRDSPKNFTLLIAQFSHRFRFLYFNLYFRIKFIYLPNLF
jgi:hypothetical protein